MNKKLGKTTKIQVYLLYKRKKTKLPNRIQKAKERVKKVGGEFSNTRIKETVTIAKAETCDVCGTLLDQTPCQGIERRTKIDDFVDLIAIFD